MGYREGVEAFLGHPGSGKTYSMVKKVSDTLKTRSYRYKPLYTNMTLKENNLRSNTGWKGSLIRLHDLDQLYYIESGILLLDEGHIWFPAIAHKEIPREMFEKWSQCRKDDLYIVISSQAFGRLYNVIRQIIHTVYYMYSFRGIGFFTGMVHNCDAGKIDKKALPNIFVFSKKVCNMYDTFEKITLPLIYKKPKTEEDVKRHLALMESVKYKTKEQIIAEEKEQKKKKKKMKSIYKSNKKNIKDRLMNSEAKAEIAYYKEYLKNKSFVKNEIDEHLKEQPQFKDVFL